MTNGRLVEIERLFRNLARSLADALARLARAEQAIQQVSGGRGGGGGGITRLHWARIPTGGVLAATGTWPSLVAESFASDVYKGDGSGLLLVSEDATVYWRYLDGADAGSLVPCVPNGDGSYDAITNSCTPIPEDA